MSCEVINPTAALPELGVGETHIHTTIVYSWFGGEVNGIVDTDNR